MKINEIANTPLSRQEVFEIAKSEHANAGTLVDELPESWTEGKQGFTDFGNPYYHFGIYWNNAASWGGHTS